MKVMHAVTRGVIKRLGFKPTEAPPAHDDVDSQSSPLSIPEDYKTLIAQCFFSMGLSEEHISITVRPVGLLPSGLEVYAAFVKVVRWDLSMAALLSDMSLIEKMIDRGIRRSDMPRYSGFAGVWFRSPPVQDGFAGTVH